MANPAALLHKSLSKWRAKKTQFADPTEQRIAVGHLNAIAELLNEMDDAGHDTRRFRTHYNKWVSLTLHNPYEWQKKEDLLHKDDAALDHLGFLADWLDLFRPKLISGGLEDIRAYLGGVRDLLDEDTTIADDNLKRHLKQVINHVEYCVNEFDAVGEFDLQDAIQRLIAVMVRVTVTSSWKDRWKEKLNNAAWPFAMGAMGELVTGTAQIAISSGLGL